MITRTVTTFEITAFTVDKTQNPPAVNEIARVIYHGTRCNNTQARAEIKRQLGMDLAKGTLITIDKVAKTTYGCTLDQFMSVAAVVAGD